MSELEACQKVLKETAERSKRRKRQIQGLLKTNAYLSEAHANSFQRLMQAQSEIRELRRYRLILQSNWIGRLLYRWYLFIHGDPR